MKLYALPLLAGLIFGQVDPAPAPKPVDQPAVVDWMILSLVLADQFHIPVRTGILDGPEDAIYIAPTANDIEQLLKFYRWRREGIEYIPESFDCDDFAREFKYLATIWSVKYYDHTQAALAVGMAYVKIDGYIEDIFPNSKGHWATGYHVLNCVLRADGKLLLFEPQTGRLVDPTGMLLEGGLEILKVNL